MKSNICTQPIVKGFPAKYGMKMPNTIHAEKQMLYTTSDSFYTTVSQFSIRFLWNCTNWSYANQIRIVAAKAKILMYTN